MQSIETCGHRRRGVWAPYYAGLLRTCQLLSLGLACLVLPGSVLAQAPQSPAAAARELQEELLLPARRAELVRYLSDPAVELPLPLIQQLLSRECSWRSHIDGAAVLSAHASLELAPLIFRNFMASHAHLIAGTANVSEPLLRALQSLPRAELSEALRSSDLSPMLAVAAQRLHQHWIGPLSDHRLQQPVLTERTRPIAEALLREWFGSVLSDPQGLVRLQIDSGNSVHVLFSRLEAVFLLDLLHSADPRDVRIALEVVVQRGFSAPELRTHLREARYDDDEMEQIRAAALRTPNPPWPVELRDPLHPLRPVSVAGLRTTALWKPWPRRRLRVGGLFLGGALLVGLWALAIRLRPTWRTALFRLAAILVGPLLILVAEGALALFGVQPRLVERPTFNPTNVHTNYLEPVEFAGRVWMRNNDEQAHYILTPVAKPENTLRVVVLGGSSVVGTHYMDHEVWAGALQRRLQARNPGIRIEVINASSLGATSGVLYQYARATLALDPDLFVLYGGWNDFVHVPQMARYAAIDPDTMALQLELDRWRVVSLLSDVLPQRQQLQGEGEGEAFWDRQAPDQEELAQLHRLAARNLEQNWTRLIMMARSEDVPVLLSVQPENEDMCPRGENGGNCFPEAVHRSVMAIAAREGAWVVDLPAVIRGHSDENRISHDYFWDEVHHTLLGHEVVAAGLVPAVEEMLDLEPVE